jgi:hypothetical protein
MKTNNPQQHLESIVSLLEKKKRYEEEELKADFQTLRESMDVTNLLKQGLKSGMQSYSMNPGLKSSVLTLVLASILNVFKTDKTKSLPTTIIGYVIKTGLISLVITKVISIFRKKSYVKIK